MGMKQLVTPAKLGVNAATVANGAPVTSNGISTENYNHMTATIALTYVAATRLDCRVEYSHDDSTYYVLPTEAVTAGVVTLTNGKEYQLATGAADIVMTIDMPINYAYVRLVIEGVGGTTDTASAQMYLGKL